MDFDPFGSLTDDKDAQSSASNWNLLSNEGERTEENLLTRTEEDVGQVSDDIFSTIRSEGVSVEKYDADDAISQQEEKYETSTDKIETTDWNADSEPPKSSQIKVKQVILIEILHPKL